MPKLYVVMEGEGIGTKRIADYMFQIAANFRPDVVFEREEDAHRHAEHLAATKVGKEIYVMESKVAVSARKPTIVVKQFNDKGEMIPI